MAEAAGGGKAPARLWLPPLLLLLLAASSWWLFNHSSRAVAERVIALYAASLVLGPSLVYPWMRARGASGRGALLGSLLVPVAWLIKEGYRITASFTVAEAFYYALNPLAQGLFAGVALQLALWEIALRRKRTGRWRLDGAPGMALCSVALYAGLLRWVASTWGPAQIFYSYVALHPRIFGAH